MNDDWNVIEDFAEYLGNRDDVWYATNRGYNPTSMSVYFQYGGHIYCVELGEHKKMEAEA